MSVASEHALFGVSDVAAICRCREEVTIGPPEGFSTSWEALMEWHARHVAEMAWAEGHSTGALDCANLSIWGYPPTPNPYRRPE